MPPWTWIEDAGTRNPASEAYDFAMDVARAPDDGPVSLAVVGDHDVRAARVGHRGPRTTQRVAVGVSRPVVADHRQRAAQLPGGERRQPALLLLVARARLEHQAGGGVGEERRGRNRVAHLLLQDHELDDAQPLAAVLLGPEDARPAERDECVPLRIGDS